MNLPVEVVQRIFHFLSPWEVVQLREVSEKFGDITHQRALWRELYANARLLLPPGPFPSQSAAYLESTLVRSESVSKTWTSRPLRKLSRALTHWKQEGMGSWTVISGRWCIYLEEKVVQCHDMDTELYYPLYDGTSHPPFEFMAYTANSTEIGGQWVCLLLVHDGPICKMRKLLGFRVNNEEFLGPEVIDWPETGSVLFDDLESWMDGFGCSTPFITVRHNRSCVVLDLRTRRLYELPASGDSAVCGGLSSVVRALTLSLQNGLQVLPISAQPAVSSSPSTDFVPTRTHVIVIRVYTRSPFSEVPVVIQAFSVPDSAACDENEVGKLRLTHQVAIRATPHCSFGLLRNSITNHVTGSVNIRLLHIAPTHIGSERKDMSCLDLTLPKPASTTSILPISVHLETLFKSRWTSERFTASDDGYARGLLVTEQGPFFLCPVSMRKISIDASGEECTVAVGDPSPLDFPVDMVGYAFDGATGRIHYFEVKEDPDEYLVVTVDLV